MHSHVANTLSSGLQPGAIPHVGESLVVEDSCPAQWDGDQVVVAFPEHIGASNDGYGDDLAVLARDAAAAQRGHLRLLDAVVSGLFHAGLSLQAAEGLPADAARRRTSEVASELDDIIGQIRVAALAEPGPPPPRRPGDDE